MGRRGSRSMIACVIRLVVVNCARRYPTSDSVVFLKSTSMQIHDQVSHNLEVIPGEGRF